MTITLGRAGGSAAAAGATRTRARVRQANSRIRGLRCRGNGRGRSYSLHRPGTTGGCKPKAITKTRNYESTKEEKPKRKNGGFRLFLLFLSCFRAFVIGLGAAQRPSSGGRRSSRG